MLEKYLQAAINAHHSTSFDPEKRGIQLINDWESVLQGDLKQIEKADEATKAQYIARFEGHFTGWLNAKSRCYSVMITGAGNFNNARHEKMNGWERSAYDKLEDFRSKAIAGILKQIDRNRPESEVQAEAWAKIEKNILESASIIVNIDAGIERRYSRALFVSSIAGLITRMAQNGQVEHVKKALTLIRDLNSKYPKPIITERNKIFSLEEKAEAAAEAQEDRGRRETKEQEIKGVAVRWNYGLDRIQLIFPDKPDYNTRTTLKKNGFRWSPREGAWQRQLTRNAEEAAKVVLNTL